jgi:sulfur carrier protein
MNIYVNNENIVLPDKSVVTDLLEQMGITARKGIAIAVNSTVVPAAEWEYHIITDQDRIMIIKATQGG